MPHARTFGSSPEPGPNDGVEGLARPAAPPYSSRSMSIAAWVTLTAVALMLARAPARAEPAPPLRLVQVIPLPAVQKRIDHLAVDVRGQRLFVAALGNGSLEVIDLALGKR